MQTFLRKKKIQSRISITLLAIAMLFTSMSMTAFAAEEQFPVVTDQTQAVDASVPEFALQANSGNEDIMPLGIGGYAAKYTNSMTGSFTVNASGDGNGSGTFQITTHDFPTSPIIGVALYRPNGTYAGEMVLNGNETKQMRFSNAIPGTYKVIYTVSGTNGGWISAWVSS